MTNDSLINIDKEITDLELEIDELNVQIEKKEIAVNAYKKAKGFVKKDQGNNSDDDPESDEDEGEFEDNEDQDNDNDEQDGLFEEGEIDDPEETIPDEEIKIMKGSYAWKAKEALRQSKKPMMIAEIAKFCKYNKKQRETMGVIISQYERTGKIFIRLGKGLYGLKALKNKY